ncbi:hypothetical protein GCM10025877_09510 [Agromyces mangrovi Wang et al. 2018]|nr:hypothetical protein GCM10025877_09510 [Agromyces mangrovi]
MRAAQQFAQFAPQFVTDAPGGAVPSTAQLALAWAAAQPGVSTVIPGARNPEQARANAAAGSITLDAGLDDAVRELYDRAFREAVHARW